MSIRELVENAKKEEGRDETLAIIDLLNEGKSSKFICKKLNVPEGFVKKIKIRLEK